MLIVSKMSNSKEAVQLKNEKSCEEGPYLPMFPIPNNGQISSEDFLVALKGLTNALDYFGKIFIAIKYDLKKTLEKLTKLYESDRESNSTIQKMMLEDRQSKTPIMFSTLTWLWRNLHMIQLFFELIVNHYSTGNGSDDIVAPLNKSYLCTLESYHECMSQQLFGLLCRTPPTRSEILKNIANGSDVTEGFVINCMDKCSRRLKENIKVLELIHEEYESN